VFWCFNVGLETLSQEPLTSWQRREHLTTTGTDMAEAGHDAKYSFRDQSVLLKVV
jgi:hypothetical protein